MWTPVRAYPVRKLRFRAPWLRSLFECKFSLEHVEVVQAALASEDIMSLDDIMAIPHEARVLSSFCAPTHVSRVMQPL
jgi:hypothetical protein